MQNEATRRLAGFGQVGFAVAFAILGIDSGSAHAARRSECRAECAPAMELVCAGLRRGPQRKCKNRVIKVCVRQGVEVCSLPTTTNAPTTTTSTTTTLPAVPQCASDVDCSDGNSCNGAETCVAGRCSAGTVPTCSDGSSGLWTGTATAASGAYVSLHAFVCRDGAVVNGQFTCGAGNVECPIRGVGKLGGSLIGTNFNAIGTNDLRDPQPFFCQFNGQASVSSITGTLECADNSSMVSRLTTDISATFRLDRCSQ